MRGATRTLVWGGYGTDSGALYSESSNTWLQIPADPALSSRRNGTGVWAGTRFLMYGGLYRGSTLDPNVYFRDAWEYIP